VTILVRLDSFKLCGMVDLMPRGKLSHLDLVDCRERENVCTPGEIMLIDLYLY